MPQFIDLTGRTFGLYSVIRRKPGRGKIVWECQCRCGEKEDFTGSYLSRGLMHSCGGCGHPRRTTTPSFACRECGESFFGKSGANSFCSDECRRELRRRLDRDKKRAMLADPEYRARRRAYIESLKLTPAGRKMLEEQYRRAWSRRKARMDAEPEYREAIRKMRKEEYRAARDDRQKRRREIFASLSPEEKQRRKDLANELSRAHYERIRNDPELWAASLRRDREARLIHARVRLISQLTANPELQVSTPRLCLREGCGELIVGRPRMAKFCSQRCCQMNATRSHRRRQKMGRGSDESNEREKDDGQNGSD